MPKIQPDEQIKEDTEEEIKEEKIEEEEKESPKLSPSARDNDITTQEIAQDIFNKMFSLEKEEVNEEEKIIPMVMENNQGILDFDSEGGERVITVYPPNPKINYLLEIQDEFGKNLKVVSGLIGAYKAKINFIKGHYKFVVHSPDTLPFTIKLQ